MDKKRFLPIGIMILCTFCTSIAQIFLKKGANVLSFDFAGLFLNYYLIIGALFYVIGAVLLIIALKYGELSVTYPIVATSYIWVTLVSYYLFSETVGPYKIAGVGVILLGVSLLGFSGGSK